MAAGCGGGGGKKQDAKEPSGSYPIEVVDAEFPREQKLSKRSSLRIDVRNPGPKTIPNVNVTLKCENGIGGSFDVAAQDADVADKQRPQFIIDKIPTRTPRKSGQLDLDPLERSSAFVDTFPLGPLAANKTARFEWRVTAVKAGPYRVCYRVNAGLYGKAKAQGTGLNGRISGIVSNKAPRTRVAGDGETVVGGE